MRELEFEIIRWLGVRGGFDVAIVKGSTCIDERVSIDRGDQGVRRVWGRHGVHRSNRKSCVCSGKERRKC